VLSVHTCMTALEHKIFGIFAGSHILCRVLKKFLVSNLEGCLPEYEHTLSFQLCSVCAKCLVILDCSGGTAWVARPRTRK
jgi:hypothetical protein